MNSVCEDYYKYFHTLSVEPRLLISHFNEVDDLLRNMVGIRACASLVNDIELTGY